MARLETLLQPGEAVRWRSAKAIDIKRIAGWGTAYVVLCGAISFAYARVVDVDRATILFLILAGAGVLLLAAKLVWSSACEAIVTAENVIWADAAPLFGRHRGTVPLRDIRAVELEEGGHAVTLHCKDGTHRIEAAPGSDLLAMAMIVDRPTRRWRECKSPAARQARRWRLVFVVATSGGTFALVLSLLSEGAGRIFGSLVAMILARWIADIAGSTLPHLLVGRRLSGASRRDFVGWLTDLRWRGVKPELPDDSRLPRSRLGEWAMRVAYGRIPDLGERTPEIVIDGAFPEDGQ